MNEHDSDEKGLLHNKTAQKILKYLTLFVACLIPFTEDLYSSTTPDTAIPLPELSIDQEYFLIKDDLAPSADQDDLFAEHDSDTEIIEIDMDEIYINELAPSLEDIDRKYPNPEECVEAVWEEKDIIAYYGNNLVPPYIPAGLQESRNNAAQNVILSKEGDVWEDTVRLDFYHDYYEDESPKIAEDIAAKGFRLNASKIGLLTCLCYTAPASAAKASNIGGTAVYIFYQSMEYGPYDPDTREPCGYYDRYAALFSINGIEYELDFSQIELEDVVKVAASIIYDDSDIMVVN